MTETFCKLHLGDCIEFMASLPDHSVDLILGDPPYNISEFGKVLTFDDRKDFDGIISLQWDVDFDPADLKAHFDRILAPKGNIALFCGGNLIGAYYDTFNADYTTNVGAWVKSNPPPKVRKTSFLAAIDHIMFFWRRGEPHTFNFGRQNDMHNAFIGPLCQGKERLKNPNGDSLHKTQKPLWIMEKLLLVLSNPGAVVFDPYGGTFTTGHAALKHGRSFIGCEINLAYFEAGVKRLREVKAQGRLF